MTRKPFGFVSSLDELGVVPIIGTPISPTSQTCIVAISPIREWFSMRDICVCRYWTLENVVDPMTIAL